MLLFSSASDPRLRPAHPLAVRAAGAVLFAFGVGISALLLWFGFLLVTTPKRLDASGLWLISILSPIATFCLVVGIRMLANRPNAYGSVLSPVGWYVLASTFAVFAVVLASVTVVFGDLSVLGGTAWGCIFAGWCLLRARRCIAEGRTGKNAP